MWVINTLRNRRSDLQKEIELLRRELRHIEIALDAIAKAEDQEKAAAPDRVMPIDDAVIEAVKNGIRSPSTILKFLETNLHINTTINSVRTRVSRLKNDGRLARDERGWIMPSEVRRQLPLNGNAPPDEGGADTEEVGASSEDTQSAAHRAFHG